MSSGKLDINPNGRINKLNVGEAYSEFLYPINNLEFPLDSAREDISQEEYDVDEFYYKAFDIHLLLLRNEKLSNKEKLDLCKAERKYIKLYLRTIVKRIYL